jgi:hypothetical protein
VHLSLAQHSSVHACGLGASLCCVCDDVQLEGQLQVGYAGEGHQAVIAEQGPGLATEQTQQQQESSNS